MFTTKPIDSRGEDTAMIGGGDAQNRKAEYVLVCFSWPSAEGLRNIIIIILFDRKTGKK